jgi:predicted membrane protein
MSSRLSDVLPITIGGYLVCLGAVFLVDSTGARPLGVAGLIGSAFGLAFVALGVLAVLAAWRVRRVSRRLRRTIGHVQSTTGLNVQDAVISTVLGDISLDLRQANLPEGETELTLLCWVGAVHVRIPSEVGVDVTAQAIVGSVAALGRREEGFVRDIHVTSEDYEGCVRRLKLRLSTVIGEVTVVRGRAPAPPPVQAAR